MMRWLTALAIICICAVPTVWGWETVTFAAARAPVLDKPLGGAALIAWKDVPGLGVEALERSLRDPATAALPPARREPQFVALVTARPMSGQAWLALAGQWSLLRRPAANVEAAVTMSQVTSPNEGALMWQRGLFELSRWPVLSPDAQHQATVDVVGGLDAGIVNTGGINLAKAIVMQQLPAARADITKALRGGGMSQAQLALIGLGSDHS